jgi:primosomal protein N' (replication factor Y)
VIRCAECGLALVYSRAAAGLHCRLCDAHSPLPETCPGCRGRRLSPFGWGAERVEHAVRRRFPRARVARYEPDARGARAEAQRAAAAAADVVIGMRGAIRLFGPGALALAGFVSPDQLLRVPDFRAGERMLALLWAAAERIRPGGAMVIQSQNPEHHAFTAVASQSLERFYAPELSFRGELGYPPFRRLAVITLQRGGAELAEGVAATLRGTPGLTVYGPAPGRLGRVQRIVVKGRDDLGDVLGVALAEAPGRAGPRKNRGIMDVEVDPIEWPS